MAIKHDAGYTLTEQELEALEKRIHAVYDSAAKDLQNTANQYFSKFTQQDQTQAQLVADGKLSASEYRQWRINTFGRGERFSQMASVMAERATRANEVSAQYVNNAMPSVYSINRNYVAYALDYDIRNGRTTFNNGDQYSGSIDWNLMDESTVRRLLVEEPELMPNYPQNLAVRRGIDLAYGQRKIGEAVTSGIIRGSSIGEIANELTQTVTGMSRTSALRAARTAMTSAQNAGRQDQINYAVETLGIEMKKMWMSVSDTRTRDSHRELNRVIVEYDKKFPNGLMYPGDRSGRPEEVYNCRCSFGYVLPEMEEELTGNGKYSTGNTVESYKEWVSQQNAAKSAGGWGGFSDTTPSYTHESSHESGGEISQQQHNVNNAVDWMGGSSSIDAVVGDEYFPENLSAAIAYVDPNDPSKIYFRDEKEIEEYISTRGGLLHKNATPQSVAVHEGAHAVSVGKDEGIVNDAVEWFKGTEEYNRIVDSDVMFKYLDPWQVAAETVSRTATTTKHELFAEAMADVYANGDNAASVSKKIRELWLANNTGTAYTVGDVGETMQLSRDTSKLPTIILPKKEWAHVYQEISTHVNMEESVGTVVSKNIGGIRYTFEVHEFGSYRVIGREIMPEDVGRAIGEAWSEFYEE